MPTLEYIANLTLTGKYKLEEKVMVFKARVKSFIIPELIFDMDEADNPLMQ